VEKPASSLVSASSLARSVAWASPAAASASSSSTSALQTPVRAAMSPPLRTWTICEAIVVSCKVSISPGFCGLMKRTSPRSRSGLKPMIFTPRFAASCSW
jgi:hypothetical protein